MRRPETSRPIESISDSERLTFSVITGSRPRTCTSATLAANAGAALARSADSSRAWETGRGETGRIRPSIPGRGMA